MDNKEERDWKDMIGDFFQGLADLIDRAGEPIFSFIAVTVPFIAPIVIAQITATALVVGNILTQTQANQLAYVLEGIGLVGLSGLVIAIDRWIRSKNEKMDSMIYLLGIIDLIYFAFLIFVNVMLDRQNPNVTSTQLVIKALICVVPLMAGGIYGYYRIIQKDKIVKREKDKQEKEIRLEQNDLKLKKTAIKKGFNPFATNTQTFASDTQTVRESKVKHASDYQDKMVKVLAEHYSKTQKVLRVVELVSKFNLDYGKSKGFVSNLRKNWMNENNIQET